MPKKIAATGMLIAAAGGCIITSVPAFAETPSRDHPGSDARSRKAILARHGSFNDNDSFNHTRRRTNLINRNSNATISRTRSAASQEALRAIRRAAVAAAAAAPCIATEVGPGGGNTKFVAVTQNGQLFVQVVDLEPTPTAGTFQNITSRFPGITPGCVALATHGNFLHITVIGTNGQVQESECSISPISDFPGSCSAPIDLGTPTSASASALAAGPLAGARSIPARRPVIRPQTITRPAGR